MELIVYIHVHCVCTYKTYNAFNYLHSSCKKVDVQVIYNYHWWCEVESRW